jgi:hypothetical protein
MSLQRELDAFKAAFESGGPPYKRLPRAHRDHAPATEELRRSGLAERPLKVGDLAPTFELDNQDGQLVRSVDLRLKARW